MCFNFGDKCLFGFMDFFIFCWILFCDCSCMCGICDLVDECKVVVRECYVVKIVGFVWIKYCFYSEEELWFWNGWIFRVDDCGWCWLFYWICVRKVVVILSLG